MAQGQRITDWQIETIRFAYAESGNVSYAARAAGCAFNTAKKYVGEHLDDLTELRNKKRADVVSQVAALRVRIIEEMFNETKVNKASLPELGILFGILTDKHQLLTGKATSRSGTEESDDPALRLTPDELEAASRIRAKLAAEVG